MSLAQRFISGASFSLVASVAMRGASFVSSIILARFLGASDFGVFATINSMVAMSVVFSIFGLSTTATKYISEYAVTDKEKAGRTISMTVFLSLLTGIIFCLLIFLLSGPISSKIYSNPGLEPVLKIAVVYLFFLTLTHMGNGIIQGFQDFKAYARVSVITSLLTPAAILLLAWKWGVKGAILAWAAIYLVNSALLSFAVQKARKRQGISLSLRKSFSEIKPVLNFALPVFLMGIVVAPANWLAYTYLARTFGFDQVGIFNVANALSQLVMFLPMILLTPILPIFSEIQASGDKTRFSKLFRVNLKLLWLFTLPLVVFTCSLSKAIISILYGAEYSAAFLPASIMLITALLMVINSAAGTGIISSSERVWHGFGLNFFWFLIFVTSSYFFIPLHGALGLSLAFIVSYAIFSFAVWFYSISVMKVEYPCLSGVIILTVVSTTLSLLVPFLFEESWVWITGISLTLVLVGAEWKLFLNKDEKGLLIERFNYYRSRFLNRKGQSATC